VAQSAVLEVVLVLGFSIYLSLLALLSKAPLCSQWMRRRELKQTMTCQEIARHLAELHPDLGAAQLAQLCLLVLRTTDSELLMDRASIAKAARAASFRLDAATDQHAAMTAELEILFGDGPVRFSADQIWTLLRAVKVQSQLLELYSGAPAMA